MNRAITMIAYTLIPIIAGCASTGSHTSSGREITNIQESLSKGEIRLTCDIACSGSWGAKRKEMKSLYENELWEDLASTVARLGFRSDQTYYYLGRSAEGLGHRDAARTYYKLAKTSYKCDGFPFNNCDGLVFPLMLDERLKMLGPKIAEAALLASPPIESVAHNKTDMDEESNDNRSTSKETPSDSNRYIAASTPIKKSKISAFVDLEYKPQAALLRDIETLKKETVVKKPLETNSEYRSRISDLKRKYSKRAYQITLPIRNGENKPDGLAYFDPESNTLKVSLPRAESNLLWLKNSEERDLKWVTMSYIELGKANIDSGSYTASNKLGVTVEVSKLEYESNGIAVLTTATSDYSADNTQSFTINMEREAAKNLLSKGKVRLNLMMDEGYMEDDESPFIFNSDYEHEPKIDKPIHFVERKYMLPVRLIEMSLLDQSDSVIYKINGSQIITDATKN